MEELPKLELGEYEYRQDRQFSQTFQIPSKAISPKGFKWESFDTT